MKTGTKGVALRFAVALAAAASLAVVVGESAVAAGIKDSKHNLGSQQTAVGANKFTETGEICVFCHTPHGADTAAKIPLWNRSASSTTYQTYNSLGTLSLDGGTAAVGSTSVACLSCHDGVQAMNTVINAPGSGLAGSAAWQAGKNAGTGWVGDRQNAGKMTNDNGGVAAVAADAASLKNDHPIGIQYAGGPKDGLASNIPAAPTTYPKANFKDPDFKPALSATLGGAQVWWVETNDDGARQKTDLPLYARTGTVTFTDGSTANIAAAQPFVECASCHDPHSDKATFLRVENTNSAVCLACHDK
jgi:predicted CXXCH cytochrome family protein